METIYQIKKKSEWQKRFMSKISQDYEHNSQITITHLSRHLRLWHPEIEWRHMISLTHPPQDLIVFHHWD